MAIPEETKEPVVKNQPAVETVSAEASPEEVKNSPQIEVEEVDSSTEGGGEKTQTNQGVASGNPVETVGGAPADEAPIEEKSFNKKNILIGVLVIVGIGLIVAGVFFFKKPKAEEEITPETPTTAPIEAEAPTATPAPELKREDLTIQVLNGGGVAGTAGVAKELLEGLGYPEIETGNADNYDYEETEVAIKEDKKDYLEMLLADLESDYSVGTESGVLDESSEFDAVVTVGKE